jgi:DNA processing protein
MSTRTWRDAAEIARRAGMAPEDAEAILGLLHLEGSATRTPAGWRLTRNAV